MSSDDIETQASLWLARDDRGLTAQEQAELAAWLEQSTLHKVAYLRLKATWRRADRLAALKQPVSRETRGGILYGVRPVTAAAVLLAMLACGGYLAYRMTATKVYATEIGRTQAVRLADGTRMELNTNTRVHAEVTRTRRTVTLETGEAYFDVVHDAKRPFVVYAGNRRITDLGTKFSVARDGDDVRVVVREGRVRVDVMGAPVIATPVVADGGRVVIAKGAQTLVFAKQDRDIANDLSWRSGMLVFNQQPLADAAEQFNRYNIKQIVVEGSARKIRIGGSFKADNVDVFVFLLHQGFGLSVNDRGSSVVVSR